MGFMKRGWTLIIVILLTVIAAGCGRQPESAGPSAAGSYLTLSDDAGRTVVLPKKPERIVVLSTSLLELLYAVDGQAVGRPSSKTGEIPAAAQAAAEVGFVYNINIEKVVSLQPDLVIAFQGINDKLVPVLASNNIPVLLVRIKTYQDVLDKVRLFSAIAGTGGKGDQVASDIQGKVRAVVEKAPDQTKKVAILHASAKSVTVDLENSIAGNVAQILRLQNVAAGARPLDNDPDTTPYSLEKLVETNPDMIFVVSMGKGEDIEKRLQADVESNPAWATLTAVQNKQVFFLPAELFLLNPGLKYPEAVAHMARLAYPEIFKNGR